MVIQYLRVLRKKDCHEHYSPPLLKTMPGDTTLAPSLLPGSFHDLARLGALHRAVWDDFGQLHNPVVDLVPATALHCGTNGGQSDSVKDEQPFLPSHITQVPKSASAAPGFPAGCPYLHYVEPFASHLELFWEPLTS